MPRTLPKPVSEFRVPAEALTTRLTEAEERELLILAKQGDTQASHKLFMSVLLWGYRTARKFAGGRLDVDDVQSAAHVGIMETINRRHDPARGRLVTSITWGVRAAVGIELRRRHLVSIANDVQSTKPPSRSSKTHKDHWARRREQALKVLESLRGREPLDIFEGTEPRVSDDSETDPLDRLVRLEELAHLRAMADYGMSRLPERLRELLRLRLWEGLTLEKVGEQLDITRERVRQLEIKAKRLLHEAIRDGQASGDLPVYHGPTPEMATPDDPYREPTRRSTRQVKRILAYVQTCGGDSVSASQVAAALQMSERTVRNVLAMREYFYRVRRGRYQLIDEANNGRVSA